MKSRLELAVCCVCETVIACDCPRVGRKMDAGRQRASNDRVLDGDLIANRNSSAKHKKGLVAENKRLFLLAPREYSDPRDCSIAERAALPRSIYTCTIRYRVQSAAN